MAQEGKEFAGEIRRLIREELQKKREGFIEGKTPVLTGQGIYDEKEIAAVVESLVGGWLGLAEKGELFESEFSKLIGMSRTALVNSGSSANLLALNSIKICRKLEGGEVIVPACTFPTTINPIIQLGFTPHFIDVDKTLNITPEGVARAINENTKGIIFAHSLGNPARITEIMELADTNGLFVVEDCGDALCSAYDSRPCGSFGDASTFSFYPAHMITMGEGGAVATNSPELIRKVRSLRDWGRDCGCSNHSNINDGACQKRFDYRLGAFSYDHRYVYSEIGYNMKPLELQAAMCLEQLKRLPEFVRARKRNLETYEKELSPLASWISLPEINKGAEPVFFGLPLIINDQRIKRQELIKFLNEHKISTRLLFAGNAVRQPAYNGIKYSRSKSLDYSDKLMRDCFWIGIHPGISDEMISYVVSKLKEFGLRH